MFDFRRRILLITVAIVVIGCADNSDRMDSRVGLFFTEDTRSLITSFEPRYVILKDEEVKYDLRVGKDLVSTLTRASRHVFASVEVLDSCPTPELIADMRLDLVIIAQVKHTGGSLSYIGDSSEASNSLTGELICYNTGMNEIASFSAAGEGIASAKGVLFDTKRRAFVNSVKSAIRDLGDDVVLQMSANQEIRKMAEKVNATIPPWFKQEKEVVK